MQPPKKPGPFFRGLIRDDVFFNHKAGYLLWGVAGGSLKFPRKIGVSQPLLWLECQAGDVAYSNEAIWYLAHGSPKTYQNIDVSLVYSHILMPKQIFWYPTQDANDHQKEKTYLVPNSGT